MEIANPPRYTAFSQSLYQNGNIANGLLYRFVSCLKYAAGEGMPDFENYDRVDAVCIDQGNLTEHNNQVRRMKSIYENAEDVMVWLGPQQDHSDLATRYVAIGW